MSLRLIDSRVNAIAIAIGLSAPICIAVLVFHNAVNVPVGDEWAWVSLLIQEHTSGITFSDIWAQHNEHRVIFPTFIMLALDRIGGFNVVREIALSLAIALFTQVLLTRLIARTMPTTASAVFFAVTSLLTFSMTQYENWTWGFQMAWFLVNLCAVASIILLTGNNQSIPELVGACVCAVVASFSLSSGFDVWIAGAFVILLIGRSGWWRLIPWMGLAAISVAVYLSGYVKPAYHPSTTLFLVDPAGFVTYILTYLGAPFHIAIHREWVAPTGFLVSAMFVATLLRVLWPQGGNVFGDRRSVVPWLGIALFAAIAAVMTAVGRFGFGIGQAFASRYVTVSSLFWIGTLGATCVVLVDSGWFARDSRARPVAGAVLAIFLVAYIWANEGALAPERILKRDRIEAYAAMLDVRNADNESLRLVYPDPNAVRELTGQLSRLHEGPFR